MRGLHGPWPPMVAALAAFGFALAARALGFGEDGLVGATPASAVALAAGLTLHLRGAVAAGLGIAAAGLVWGLPPGAALADGSAHALAAFAGSTVMRTLARRREIRSRTSDWIIFLAGVVTFATTVAAALTLAVQAGLLAMSSTPLAAMIYEPLGIMTLGAALASVREAARVRADPGPAIATAALGLFLLGVLWVLLGTPLGTERMSAVTLLLSMPFCIWVAMQRRSLDGAALSFLAAHAVLVLLLREAGSIARPDFVAAVIYLNLLVAVCQLVHAVNLDRLEALAEVETQKRELEARVVERTARLELAIEAAQAADAAKTRFVTRVSHEVRTPLNGVLGMAAVVLDGPLEPQVRRNVELIRTSGIHLLDVINRLLDFSRLDRPLRESEFGPFDLAALAEEVLAEARCLPYAETLTLRLEIAAGVAVRRRGYRHGLRQILTNLVGNAAKFTDRGSVTIRIGAPTAAAVRIEVADTGIGMTPAQQERVFLPYEQVDEASVGRYGGTGLGLAICADIVKRLHGRIGVSSATGAGSTFWFEVDMPPLEAPQAAITAREAQA